MAAANGIPGDAVNDGAGVGRRRPFPERREAKG